MQDTSRYYSPLELINWQPRKPEPTPNVGWAERQRSPTAPPTATAEPTPNVWQDLQQCVASCQACPLHTTRTQTVFGTGNQQARLMIIGEAPGFHEDQQGAPFVGRAGQLLTAMLKSVGFSRDEVFIANILKCRPPENRDPSAAEVASCTPFLNQQIDLIKPQLLLAVGRIAAHYLLDTKKSLESLRNQTHMVNYSTAPLIVTYHPAYLLRSPSDKKKAYSDLLFIKKTLSKLD